MKIKMLQSCRGSDVDHEGVSLGSKLYVKDDVFEVVSKGVHPHGKQIGESLAKSFCQHAKVAEVTGESPETDESPKDGAPENKMERPSENKRTGKSRSK